MDPADVLRPGISGELAVRTDRHAALCRTEIDPAHRLAPCIAGQHPGRRDGDTAIGRGHIDPAIVLAPCIAGNTAVTDRDVAVSRAETNLTAIRKDDRVLVRRINSAVRRGCLHRKDRRHQAEHESKKKNVETRRVHVTHYDTRLDSQKPRTAVENQRSNHRKQNKYNNNHQKKPVAFHENTETCRLPRKQSE